MWHVWRNLIKVGYSRQVNAQFSSGYYSNQIQLTNMMKKLNLKYLDIKHEEDQDVFVSIVNTL